jgi:hypothetical protein
MRRRLCPLACWLRRGLAGAAVSETVAAIIKPMAAACLTIVMLLASLVAGYSRLRPRDTS